MSTAPQPPAPNDTPQVLLQHHLKLLRLPTFLREYDKVARQCAQEQVDYPRYLLRLSELELVDREHRATERRSCASVKVLIIGAGGTIGRALAGA
jgi:hypothetical protein